MARIVEINIADYEGLPYVTPSGILLGTRYDNNAQILNFVRPNTDYAEYDLVLSFSFNNNCRPPLRYNIKQSDEFSVPISCTRELQTTMSVAFTNNSDTIVGINKIIFSFRENENINEIYDEFPSSLAMYLETNAIVSIDYDELDSMLKAYNKFDELVSETEIQATGGTSNYNTLSNKPSINNIVLIGNQTGEQLGLVDNDEFETIIDGINNSISVINGNISTINTNISNLETKVDSLETTVTDINSEIETINNEINEINTKINSQTLVISNIQGDIDALTGRVGTIEDNINTIDSSISSINDSIDFLSTSVNNINNSLTTINEKLTELETGLDTNTTAITNLQNDQSELETKVSENTSNIETILESLGNKEFFRGYYPTTASLDTIENPVQGDYAFNAETGTKWIYNNGAWEDSGVEIPTGSVPASDDTPMPAGVASAGTSNAYSRGDHIHAHDNTKADDSEVVHIAGNENITGSKIFTLSPLVPAPTSDSHAANKEYVDNEIANVDVDLTEIEDKIETNTNNISTLRIDVNKLQTDVTNAENDIETLKGQVTTVQQGVNTLDGRVTPLEVDLEALQASYNTFVNTTYPANRNVDIAAAVAQAKTYTDETIQGIVGALPTSKIYVNKNSTAATETGSIYAPYKTIQAALNGATEDSDIDVSPDVYTEDLTFAASHHVFLHGSGAIGQRMTVVNGNVTISDASDGIGISSIQFSGELAMNSAAGSLYFDNCHFSDFTCSQTSAGVIIMDYCDFDTNMQVYGQAIITLRNCDFGATAIYHSRGNGLTNTGPQTNVYNCVNFAANHLTGALIIGGNTRTKIFAGQACISSSASGTANPLLLWSGTTAQPDGSFGTINQITSDGYYGIGAFVHGDSDTFYGIRIEAGMQAADIVDYNTYTHITPSSKFLVDTLKAIDDIIDSGSGGANIKSNSLIILKEQWEPNTSTGYYEALVNVYEPDTSTIVQFREDATVWISLAPNLNNTIMSEITLSGIIFVDYSTGVLRFRMLKRFYAPQYDFPFIVSWEE